MCKYYIKPTLEVITVDSSCLLAGSNELGDPWQSGDAKHNNDDFAFDDSSEDEYEDDGLSWSRPTYHRPHFH